MQGYHDAAKRRIFAARNSSSGGYDDNAAALTAEQMVDAGGLLFIDLHGLHVSESLDVLQGRIMALRRVWPDTKRLLAQEGRSEVVGLHLHVITGTGHHASDHQSHLGPKVERFFAEEGIQYSVPKWGALLARVI